MALKQLSLLWNLAQGWRLTLAIQGTTLRLLSSHRGRVGSWVNLPFNPAFFRQGFVANSQGMAQVIRNALNSKGLPLVPVNAAFSGFQSLYRILRLPRAKDVDPSTAIPREARRLMAFSETQHHLFWQPVASSASERIFLALAVPRGPLLAFIETLKLAGLAINRIGLTPLLLLKAAQRGEAIVVNIETNSIDLVIARGSLPLVMRSLLLEELLMPDTASPRVVEELVRILSFYADANPEDPLPPQTPVVLGGGLAGEELASAITREIGHPVMEYSSPLGVPQGFPIAAMASNLALAVR